MDAARNDYASKNTLRFFVAIFFFSGIAGLGYQVVWAKAFAAAIGHEFPAMLAVVTAFMSGMALGNALLIRHTKFSPRFYGWLEIVIGVWAAATIGLIPLLDRLVASALGLAPSPLLQYLVVFMAVLVILLPATAAIGATLPAAERFLFGRVQRHTTGLLYASNTAGAMFGALAAAFLLMPLLGLRWSVVAFALLNLACGAAAIALARGQNSVQVPLAPLPGRSLALRLFFCGFLGIGFEVVVVRALAHVLENTVFTFAVVLAVYLAGNALGAGLFHRAQPTRFFRKQESLFGLLSLSCIVSAITLRWSPTLYLALRNSLGDSLSSVAAAEAVTAAAFVLLPSICMGMVWTSLAQCSLPVKNSLAWAVAINTAGAALAPLLFGLLIVPTIGLRGALAVLPMGSALLAARSRITAVTLIATACAIPFMTSVRDLIDLGGDRIISLREGLLGSVAVLEDATGARLLKFNNRFQMGGTAARTAEERQADLPLLLHPAPKRALFIGLGTGITFATAANFPGLQADGVELVPEIAATMPLFNHDTTFPQSLQTYVADGRRFVRASQTQYDVIVSDLFHPAQDGAGFLYTLEHFTALRARLAPTGLFCQWLPLHQMDLQTLRIILSTFASVFPHGEIWLLRFNIDVPVIGLIAREPTTQLAPDLVETKSLGDETLATHLRKTGLNDSVRLFGCYLGAINPTSEVLINSDQNPIVIFRAPSLTFRRNDDPGQRLLDLLDASSATLPPGLFPSASPPNFITRVNDFIQARNIYLRGLHQEKKGDATAALASYIESAKVSADFTAGYAQALALATVSAKTRPAEARAILEKLIQAQPDRPVARDLLDRLPK